MATLQENLDKVWALSGGVTNPGDAKVAQGWIAEIPTFQNFNYVLQALTKNNLSLAEKGSWAWQAGIDYEPTAVVNKNGIVYKCVTAHLGSNPQDPELDTTNSYWVFGAVFGNVDPSTLSVEDGVLLQNMNPRSGLTWSGQDMTIQNETALINLKTDNAGTGNWLFGNVAGSLVAVDVGTLTSPDNRSLALSESTVHKIYHEGNKPVQADVAGTIPSNPVDGKLYGRRDGNWVEVTGTTVSDEPPPPVKGIGNQWYNLLDGKLYVDINDGDSSQWVPANPPVIPADDGGFGGINWAGNIKTIPFSALANNGYHVGGVGITVTFPASPTDGDVIALSDLTGKWDQNTVRVSGNGKSFRSPNTSVTTTDVILDYRGGYVEFIYSLSEDVWLASMSGVGAQSIVVDRFPAGNGPWTLSQSPASENSVLVIVGNVLQDPDAFTIKDKQLSISGGASGAIRVWHMGVQIPIGTPGDGTVDFDKLNTEMKGRVAAAWIQLSTIGTNTVSDSFNVSSVIDGGVGDFSVVMQNPLQNTNYAVTSSSARVNDSNKATCGLLILSGNTVPASKTKSTFRLLNTTDGTGAGVDSGHISVLVFANQ